MFKTFKEAEEKVLETLNNQPLYFDKRIVLFAREDDIPEHFLYSSRKNQPRTTPDLKRAYYFSNINLLNEQPCFSYDDGSGKIILIFKNIKLKMVLVKFSGQFTLITLYVMENRRFERDCRMNENTKKEWSNLIDALENHL